MWFFRGKSSPFAVGEQLAVIDGDPQTKIFRGVRQSDKKQVTLLGFFPNSAPLSQTLSQNAIKIWKTLRHPIIPPYIDTFVENDITYVVISEEIMPFDPSSFSDSELAWALRCITDFISFLSDSVHGVHGNLIKPSIFQTPSHEIRIGGFQWLTISNSGPINDHPGDWQQISHSSASPDSPPYVIDLASLAETFDPLSSHLPKPVQRSLRKWRTDAPPPPSSFLALDFWNKDKFSQTLLFLKELPLKDPLEREAFFRNLKNVLPLFSESMKTKLILPLILNSLTFSSTAAVVDPFLSICSQLSDADFQEVLPTILQLFLNPDRGIRVGLLGQIDLVLQRVGDKAIINDKIYTPIVGGLNDDSPQVRQATVISMVSLASHLTETNMKILVKELKRLQSDSAAQLRTNAVICLAKIAPSISEEYRVVTIVGALTKASQDNYTPCRKAALAAFKSSVGLFTPTIVAVNVIPAISPLCIDKDFEVSSMAVKTLLSFVEVIEKDNKEKEKIYTPPEEPKPSESTEVVPSQQKDEQKQEINEEENEEEEEFGENEKQKIIQKHKVVERTKAFKVEADKPIIHDEEANEDEKPKTVGKLKLADRTKAIKADASPKASEKKIDASEVQKTVEKPMSLKPSEKRPATPEKSRIVEKTVANEAVENPPKREASAKPKPFTVERKLSAKQKPTVVRLKKESWDEDACWGDDLEEEDN